MIKNVLLVAIGGGIGSILRYLCHKWVTEIYRQSFPLGTFIVNIIGCFLIGVIFSLSEKNNLLSAEWRLFLATGFCGGFTTFSTFALENVSLIRSGNGGIFVLYTAASVLMGIVAVFAGWYVSRII